MRLSGIVAQLRAHARAFGDPARIAGVAEFAAIEDDGHMALPAAFVMPLEEEAGDNASQNSPRQRLSERFGVILALDNRVDRWGRGAYDAVHDLRAEVWAALLNWAPGPEHGPIEYDGGEFLSMDRAVFLYQLAFVMPAEIVAEDGYRPDRDAFREARLNVDIIDPAVDPNLAPAAGPDGRIEHEARAYPPAGPRDSEAESLKPEVRETSHVPEA